MKHITTSSIAIHHHDPVVTAFRVASFFSSRQSRSRFYSASQRSLSSSTSFPAAYRARYATPSSSTSSEQHHLLLPPNVVSVFDNVLSPECCAELTNERLYDTGPDVYKRYDDDDQGGQRQEPNSPQDVLIESILEGLGGELFERTREVEWWGRSVYKSVEAHRDVDEEAASVRGEHRYPTHSLIVYLDVEEGLRAPTCLWVPTDITNGNNYDDDEHNNDEDDNGPRSAFVAVPAVQGRLLVLSGELLHAVPCPVLQWLGNDPLSDDHVVKDHRHHHGTPSSSAGAMRRVMVLNLWDDYAPEDEEWMYDDEEEEEEEEDQHDDWDHPLEEESNPVIEFFAKRVECQPRRLWKPMALQGPLRLPATPATVDKNNNNNNNKMDNAIAPATTITLSTRSHGSDMPFLSPLKSNSAASSSLQRSEIVKLLESKSIPHWLWTSAYVSDLGIGVPSISGSRVERME